LAYSLLGNRLGLAVAAACFWTGCYTGPINMRPTVSITAPLDPIFRGQALTYTATASDPDSDTVTLEWVETAGACPRGFDQPSAWPTTGWTPGSQLVVQGKDAKATFCVWVKASDGYGAATVDARTGDPQDRAPVAVLELASPPSAPSYPAHTPFVLSAEKSTDPDQGDVIRFEWTLVDSPSQTATLAACQPPSTDADRCLTADAPGDYQVELRVVDDSTKDSIVYKTLRVLPGQLPTAALDLVSPAGSGPYALGSPFRVSGANSTGGDPMVEYVWQLDAAPTSLAVLADCDGKGDTSVRCFVADVPGTYRVTLNAKNQTGQSPAVSATYVVAADQPPCLDQTTPDVATTVTTMTSFTVSSVSDDLDPYPGTASMQWFVSEGGGPFVLREKDFPSFPLPQVYSVGDVVRVRLEISDRDTERSAKAFLACGDADVCTQPTAIHPGTCFQRVTWTVHILP
jgi:hypothetical protein